MKIPLATPRCFLSHNSTDKTFVRRLGNDLVANDIDVWFDEWEISAGQSITQTVSDALAICDVLVIVLSKRSAASPWVKEELRVALHRRIIDPNFRVIPIMYKRCNPSILSQFLIDLAYLDFTNDNKYNVAFDMLLDAIRKRARRPVSGIINQDFFSIMKGSSDEYIAKNAQYYREMAERKIDTGDYDLAISLFEKSLKIREDPKTYFGLAVLFRRLARYEDAYNAYTRVVQLDDGNGAAWFDLATLCTNMAKYEEAEIAYSATIRLDPRHRSAWADLGYIWLTTGRYEEARIAFEEVRKHDPNNTHAIESLARIAIRQNEMELARTLLIACVERKPMDRILREDYMRVLAWTGRTDEAEDEGRKLLAERPGDTYVERLLEEIRRDASVR